MLSFFFFVEKLPVRVTRVGVCTKACLLEFSFHPPHLLCVKVASVSRRFEQRGVCLQARNELTATFCRVVRWIKSKRNICFPGVIPNTDWLAGSGVEVDPRGAVVVDKVKPQPSKHATAAQSSSRSE